MAIDDLSIHQRGDVGSVRERRRERVRGRKSGCLAICEEEDGEEEEEGGKWRRKKIGMQSHLQLTPSGARGGMQTHSSADMLN